MTRKIGGCIIIEREPSQTCARCKEKRECRDVLGDGVQICFPCAKPEEFERYAKRVFGPSN